MQAQLLRHDPAFGYRWIAGLRARVDHEDGGYLLRTNAQGFRCNHSFSDPPRDSTFRVALFGDSWTAGEGVDQNDRYGEELERRLPGLQVLNFGLDGTGIDQHYLIFNELCSTLEYDLLVIAPNVVDIRRNAARFQVWGHQGTGKPIIFAKPYFELEGGPEETLTLRNVPVPAEPLLVDALTPEQHAELGGYFETSTHATSRRLVNRWVPWIKPIAQRLTRYQPVPAYDSPNHADWRLTEAILRRWISEARSHVVLFPLPMYQHIDGDASAAPYLARFRELARATGATVVDPLPAFQRFPRAERRSLRISERDWHPNARGHSVIADALEPVLRDLIAERGGRASS